MLVLSGSSSSEVSSQIQGYEYWVSGHLSKFVQSRVEIDLWVFLARDRLLSDDRGSTFYLDRIPVCNK